MSESTIVVTFDRGMGSLGALNAKAKVFSTGSIGYHGQGKLSIDGRLYQCQVQLVEIGTKYHS